MGSEMCIRDRALPEKKNSTEIEDKNSSVVEPSKMEVEKKLNSTEQEKTVPTNNTLETEDTELDLETVEFVLEGDLPLEEQEFATKEEQVRPVPALQSPPENKSNSKENNSETSSLVVEPFDVSSLECGVCGKVMSSAEGKRNHLKNVHDNMRRFKCNICNKSLWSSTHLKVSPHLMDIFYLKALFCCLNTN